MHPEMTAPITDVQEFLKLKATKSVLSSDSVRIPLEDLEDFASDRNGQSRRDKYIATRVKHLLGVFVDDHIAAPAIDWFITPENTYGAVAPPAPPVI